jgi:hypothetical protein
MKRLIYIISLSVSFLLLSGLFLPLASAQESPIKISLLNSKASYLSTDPIHMQVSVLNGSSADVITQKGFFNQRFYLMITFIDPDGKPVFTKYQDIGYEGGPPYRYQGRNAALVEVIPTGAANTQVIDDARAFYDLPKYGRYTAQVSAFLETYSQSTQDPVTGKSIAFLDYQTGSYTVASNKVSFEIVSPEPVVTSSIEVKVNILKIGTGTRPNAEKEPLGGVPVRLYQRSAASQYEPTNWKVYPLIWNDTTIAPLQSGFTDSQGLAAFNSVTKGDYIVMTSSYGTYVGSPIGSNDSDWGTEPIQKHLMIMQKADGKKAPGKTSKLTGSLLLITEPEYVEWDSSQELYPFVFEAVEDWGVTTSVNPPDGFVADYNSLSADVNNEIEAVQFTISEVGSKWEETKIKYKIKHKGKSETIEDEIGIMLSDKLAKKLGKDKYGDTDCPGVFEGGKKIKDKCK